MTRIVRRLAVASSAVLLVPVGVGPVSPASGAEPALVVVERPVGYRLAAADGGVFAFGGSTFHGSAGGLPLNAPIVGMATTPTGRGYWMAASDGGVFAYGDARFQGSAGGLPLNAPVVGIAASPSGKGYWLAASDGGVFAYGDARFFGSAGGLPLTEPVAGIAATGDGGGYWLAGGDGGVFAYGNAPFHGRLTFTYPAIFPPPPREHVSGITVSHTGTGYWISGRSSTAYGFGDTTPLQKLFVAYSPPTVGVARTSGGPGLVMASADGRVDVHNGDFSGDLAGQPLNAPIVAVSA